MDFIKTPARPLASISPITWIISFIILSHCFIVSVLQPQPFEPMLSGAMQFISALAATATCFYAGRRRDFARPFWLLLCGTFFLWSAGEGIYLVNRFALRSPNLLPNTLLFLFFISTLPLSIAVLARCTEFEDAPTWLRWFDGMQVVGLILAACLMNLDLARGKNGVPQVELRLLTVHIRNVILALALLVRAVIAKGTARRLYAPICFGFTVFTLSSWWGNQALELWGARGGQWWDLCWSVPFCIMAVAAVQWSHQHSSLLRAHGICATQAIERPHGAIARHLTEYLYPCVLSISLVVLALEGMDVQRDIAVTLVFCSLLCFFARSSSVQFHRANMLAQLRRLLENTKRLTGYLPICAACKMIRDDSGSWRQLESYIRQYSEAEFTHGICPECAHRLYPEHTNARN